MVAAAEEYTDDFDGGCTLIPEKYRLTRNLLVALLMAVGHRELIASDTLPDAAREPNSLMFLGRSDYAHSQTGEPAWNLHLYSRKTVADEPRAFWHPGVGLWQLDDINEFARKLNHAERAHAETGAKTALMILYNNYCLNMKEGPLAPFNDEKIAARLKWSLTQYAWVACGSPRLRYKLWRNDHETHEDAKRGYETCYSTFDNIAKGKEFPIIRTSRPDGPPLYIEVHEELSHPYGGAGIKPLYCEWQDADGKRRGKMFPCFIYDIRGAEGYVWRSNDLQQSDKLKHGPLAHPFLSFTHEMDKKTFKFIVFKKDGTQYEHDLIAAVPTTHNVRTSPEGDPAQGWWHEDTVGGLSVEIVSGG